MIERLDKFRVNINSEACIPNEDGTVGLSACLARRERW